MTGQNVGFKYGLQTVSVKMVTQYMKNHPADRLDTSKLIFLH